VKEQKTTSSSGVAFLVSSTPRSNDDEDRRHGDVVVVQQDNKDNGQDLGQPSNQQQEQLQVQRYYHTFQWKYRKSTATATATATDDTAATTDEYYHRTYNINYRREGNPKDPPILLIHGFGANVNHFRYNIPLLVQSGYQVFAIDLLGFGGRDKPKDEDYSISLWVDLLCDFIENMTWSLMDNHDLETTTIDDTSETIISKHRQQHQHQQPWVVCGNSIGGLCSLGVTARMKHVVQGCVLFNCAQGMSGFRYEEAPFWLRPIM
jgi:alpha-beta hydrolase superfamily lysophospholipase